MKIKLKGKKLLINDKNCILATSGDNLTSRVEFEVERFYENEDLSEYVGSVVVDDGKNLPYTELLTTEEIGDSTVVFSWDIKKYNTCSAEIKVVLKLTKSQEENTFIWQSYRGVFKIMPTILPKADIPKVSPDLVSKIVAEGVELKEKALSFIEEASISPYIIPVGMGDGSGKLMDSGISVEKINQVPHLIASGTTAEEVSIINITDTTGGSLEEIRGFDLYRFICVKVTIPVASAQTRIWAKLNGVNVGYILNATSTATQTVSRFDIYYIGGNNWAYMGWSASNGASVGSPWTVPGYLGQGQTVQNISLVLSDNALFPVGTTYEVYGIEV